MADIDREQDKILADVLCWHIEEDHHGEFWANSRVDWVAEKTDRPLIEQIDISQALGDGKSLDTVVGKMKEKGFVLFSLAQMDNETYSACFLQLSNRIRFFGYANIPAMAICLAAEAAVQSKQGDDL